MRYLLVFVLLLSFAVTSKADTISKENQSVLLSDLLSEKAILDAAFSDNGKSLFVGVRDNGTSRDGFAMYVCEVLRGRVGGSGEAVYVKILDIVAAAMRDEHRELGKYRCVL
ncbi:MAG: hypothetical protein ABID63_18250 [Pseudomonadota bacterium]